MVVLEGVPDILLAVLLAFSKRLTLKSECAQGNFIKLLGGDVLYKNNSTWILFLYVSIELIDKIFCTFGRNFGWYFFLPEHKFVFLYHALKLFFKVRFGVQEVWLRIKSDYSSLFINVNLIGVDKILQVSVRA